jgi:hypothetical protein
MSGSFEAQGLPPSRVSIGTIDCPNCGRAQLARVLIRDEEGQPTGVCCLGCEAFFPAEDVAWRVK